MAHPARGTKPTELVVRYRYADGILIEGKTYPHRNEVKKAQPRWRWCGSLRQWGVPRTRERMLSSDQVEEYAEGLRAAGVLDVRVDYQEPRPGDVLDLDQVGEVVETLEERALDRAGPLDGATAWLDRMKPITARHFVRWLPQSYRNAMGIVDEYRARYGLELAQPRPHRLGHTAARKATETTTEPEDEPEDEEDTDSTEDEHQADEPAATNEDIADEHTTGDASARPKPRGKAPPRRLGTLERTHVHTPTEHQPPRFDVTASAPAVLMRTRPAVRAMAPLRRRTPWPDMRPRNRGPPPRPPPRCPEATTLA